MFKLLYTHTAENDLQAIYNYIAEDSPTRASKYLSRIEQCVLRLQDFPELGRNSRYAELNRLGVKALPFENYLIFYTVNIQANEVNVLRVLHGSVNYRKLFPIEE